MNLEEKMKTKVACSVLELMLSQVLELEPDAPVKGRADMNWVTAPVPRAEGLEFGLWSV